MSEALSDCYTRLVPYLGDTPEPYEAMERADQLRHYWRPNRVRLLLLAESHVHTGLEELSHQLRPQPYLPEDMPRGFVRLVYCLGYGEDGLLERPFIGSPNKGTLQFWKILYSCVNLISSNADFDSIRRGQTTLEERTANKVAVLCKLREQGVWLLDASIAALYRPGAVKPSPRTMEAVLLESWDGYVGPLVKESRPEAVLCIGKGVAGILGSRIQELGLPWGAVPQPNARLASDVHLGTFEAYYHASRDPGSLAAGQ